MNCETCKQITAPQRLKNVRNMLNFDQRTMAKLLKVSAPTMGKMENSVLTMKQKHKTIMYFVGINAEWVDYGSGCPFTMDIQVVRENIIRNLKD